jgi:hypothetical protein
VFVSDRSIVLSSLEVLSSGIRNARRVSGTSVINIAFRKFMGHEVEMAYATSSHGPVVPVRAFPAGCKVHWETQNCSVWNEQECADEEQELVYEVAWIPELDVWRRFLRSQRKVHG